MMTGTGTGPTRPRPSTSNAASRTGTSWPSWLSTCASPRPAISVASVTTMGWIPSRAISAPFSTPTAAAASSASGTATASPRSSCVAATAPAIAITDPTDRSTPPVAITSVIPTATSTTVETWSSTLNRLPVVAKFGVKTAFAATSTTSAANATPVGPADCQRARAARAAPAAAGRGGVSPAGGGDVGGAELDTLGARCVPGVGGVAGGGWARRRAPARHRADDRVLADLPAVQLGHVRAVAQHDHARAPLHQLLQVRRDHEDAEPGGRQLVHQRLDLPPRADVDPARRLVDE